MTEAFVVGIVRGSHGLSGEFKVESTSGEYDHFDDMDEVTLTDGNVRKKFFIEETHFNGSLLYMKLEGISTPEDAAKFNKWQIVVPREFAHQLQEGEYYIEDLKGCSVNYEDVTAGNTAPVSYKIGTVTNVMEGGSGYLVEIKLSECCLLEANNIKTKTESGEFRTVLVPFGNGFWGKIDVINKRMQLMHLWILE